MAQYEAYFLDAGMARYEAYFADRIEALEAEIAALGEH